MRSSTVSLVPLPISLPLRLRPLIRLLTIARKCLDNNFLGSFLTMVGCIMVFHYESIPDIQDECPLILCYSRNSGTGMSTGILILFTLSLYSRVLRYVCGLNKPLYCRKVNIFAERSKPVWCTRNQYQWTRYTCCNNCQPSFHYHHPPW